MQAWIAKNARRRSGHQALMQVRKQVNPVRREELDAVADTWVDCALRLEPDRIGCCKPSLYTSVVREYRIIRHLRAPMNMAPLRAPGTQPEDFLRSWR